SSEVRAGELAGPPRAPEEGLVARLTEPLVSRDVSASVGFVAFLPETQDRGFVSVSAGKGYGGLWTIHGGETLSLAGTDRSLTTALFIKGTRLYPEATETNPVCALAVPPRGGAFLLGYPDGAVQCRVLRLNGATERTLYPVQTRGPLRALSFSPAGEWLAL